MSELAAERRAHADEVVARARALAPALRQRRELANQLGRLPEETYAALKAAGFFRIYTPARFGGLELDWSDFYAVCRELAKGCGSAAWIVSALGSHSLIVGRFPDEAQQEVWGEDPDQLVAATSLRTSGASEPVEGGFLLQGSWRFASGIDDASWVVLAAPQDSASSDHPYFAREHVVPASAVEVVDDWNVDGLRGTGTKTVVLREPIFVPAHRALRNEELMGFDPPGAAHSTHYLFRVPFRPYFGTVLLGPIIGAAEGAVADYVAAIRGRGGDRGAEVPSIQLRFAESAAMVDCARLAAEETMTTLHRAGSAGRGPDDQEWAISMRNRAYANRLCSEAVFPLLQSMGAHGLTADNPVKRDFSDLLAMTCHAGLRWDRNATIYAKWAFGFLSGTEAIAAARTAPT